MVFLHHLQTWVRVVENIGLNEFLFAEIINVIVICPLFRNFGLSVVLNNDDELLLTNSNILTHELETSSNVGRRRFKVDSVCYRVYVSQTLRDHKWSILWVEHVVQVFNKRVHKLLIWLSSACRVWSKHIGEVRNFNAADASFPSSRFCIWVFFFSFFTKIILLNIAVAAAGKQHKEKDPWKFFGLASQILVDIDCRVIVVVILINEHFLSSFLHNTVARKQLDRQNFFCTIFALIFQNFHIVSINVAAWSQILRSTYLEIVFFFLLAEELKNPIVLSLDVGW